MIAKISKSYTETKKRTILKEVEYYENKYVPENLTQGHCARCGTSYTYGDNKVEPTKCPKCVCIDCGVSIMYRKREIAGYAHSKVDRCYSCWSLWYRGQRRSGIGVEVNYNHTFAKKVPASYQTVTKSKMVPTEEEYQETRTDLVDALNIPYLEKNKVIPKKIDGIKNILKLVNKNEYFSDEDIKKQSSWFNAQSFKAFLEDINKKVESETIRIDYINDLEYNEMIVSEKQMLEEFLDVVGFYPNVPAYIQGYPLDMYNNKRKNKVDIVRSISIYFNLTMDSTAHRNQYKNRGIICYSLIKYLRTLEQDENKTAKINLKIVDVSFIENETLVIEYPVFHDDFEKNEKLIYNILTNPAFLRIFQLEYKALLVKQNEISKEWKNGFGYCMNSNDVRKVLKLNKNDILFNLPEELNIGGLFYDDDYVSCAMELDLIDKKPYDSKKSFIQNDNPKLYKDIKKVLDQRKITKLIHVTSSDNIDSIKKNGILSIETLNNKKMKYDKNDFLRLDGFPNAISLSVENPNMYLFSYFSKIYPNKKYKIIEIDPKILYEIKEDGKEVKRIYSDYNAASHFARKSYYNFEIMYQEMIRKRRVPHDRKNKKESEPTSNQAEILFFSSIPQKYILNIKDFKAEERKW